MQRFASAVLENSELQNSRVSTAAIEYHTQPDTPLAIRANGTTSINLHSHPVDDGWVLSVYVSELGLDSLSRDQPTSCSNSWPNGGSNVDLLIEFQPCTWRPRWIKVAESGYKLGLGAASFCHVTPRDRK